MLQIFYSLLSHFKLLIILDHDTVTSTWEFSSISKWQGADLVNPFLSLGSMPDQQEVVDRSSDREMLRDNQCSCTGGRGDERKKVSRHRFSVMCHKDTPLACRARQDFWIVHTRELSL
jgi:hypothetical protein